MYENQEQYK
jgi:chromosome segregation ATPase